MRTNIFTIVFLLITLFTYSQERYNSESYNVTLEDIKTTTFAKDSTANALVIYEHGNSFVDKNDYDLRTEIQKKIKILNQNGFDNATITIHLYNNERSEEKVKNIFATTYNLINGNVVKTSLNKKDVFEEKYDENHKFIKFTLPNIKEGSVITYSYTIISPFMFNYKGWNFQDDIPKLYSEYQTSIPGNWDYNIKLIGANKLSVNKSEIKKNCLTSFNGGSADCANSVYVMKDIPAFIEEDYMTAKSNYLGRIEYELRTFKDFTGLVQNYAKTWESVDNELKSDESIGRQLSKSLKVEDLLPTEIINETDLLKKATLIYQYVQDNYTWNKEYKIFKDASVKDLIKNKSGNVSAINILLHNLLKESAIEVKPILLSTRNNGFATKLFPVISEFNYLIVQATIDNKKYLLDATDDYLNFGDVPFRCLNQYGRLLDFKNGSEWIDIEPQSNSYIFFNAELNFDEQQGLIGNIKSKTNGYHALNSKKAYYSNKDAYVKELENNSPFIEIFDHNVTSNRRTSTDFTESYQIEYKNEDTSDTFYLNPFFKVFFHENPFKLQERTYPIDFGFKDSYVYILKLNLENKYKVLEQPKDILIGLPNNTGQISFSTKVFGESVNLMMKIDFKESSYTPEYYPYLKDFMSKIVDVQKNSLLVLQKK
jgi:hypothetical protein